ncbi:hypothetical protein GWI33_014435 [Rhynchophorus ferrugineus]|uniref:Major facilitator superfamily (MFS) profile domain-containing protein n=1 Tax=Rhynchophorus ferrugineus TaxID=354439 RepID=A0A834I4I4_RHYFE|nr:hypothetical protein GWI33_014435 [Rhynchophorus ferrugineus]
METADEKKNTSEVEVDIDEVLEELGELGRYQTFIYVLICLPVLFAAENSLSYVFTAGEPSYRCYIPECENFTTTSYKVPWIENAVPRNSEQNQLIGYITDPCTRYSVNITEWMSNNQTCTANIFDRDNITRCSQWIFLEGETTIVNEWSITCIENQWMLSLIGTCHFSGIIVGSALFGILADKYGRKLIFVFSIVLMSISGVMQIWSKNYTTFAILIFINSMGTAGVYPLAFVLGVELVGKRKREVTGIVLNYFYAVGEALVALIAWLVQDWKYLQFLVSAPAIIFLGYYWIIPESVRWLLANSRSQKARSIVLKVAKYNRVELSETLLMSFDPKTVANKPENTTESSGILPIVKEMLHSRKLLVRFVVILFIWAVNAFVYYGLSINSTSLSGNKYVNFALVSLIEIPGYSLAWISIQTIGRKPSLVLSLLLSGVTCTLTIFLTDVVGYWMVILLFLLGKMGITSAFGVVYVHTAEMLPTRIRSGGVGMASTSARLGALLAPFVPLLGVYMKSLPMLLFGGLGIVAGLFAFKLPETLGQKLPETVAEAEDL